VDSFNRNQWTFSSGFRMSDGVFAALAGSYPYGFRNATTAGP
jgi:hypothetical protein